MLKINKKSKVKTTLKMCISIVVLLASSQKVDAQSVDLFFGGGTASFLGDLGGKPTLGTNDAQDLDILSTRYGLTAGARFNFGKYFALRSQVWYARLSANDKYTVNLQRRDRNLSFFTNIFEADALAEINIKRFNNGAGLLYVFGGVGYFHFNPKTRMNGQVYQLRDYGTEGQFYIPGKSPYSLNSIAFPSGFGYKMALSRGSYLAFELNMRKTKTDYIDDVSGYFADPVKLAEMKGPIAAQLADRSNGTVPFLSSPGSIRGHYWNNDSYFFLSITYNTTLGASKRSSSFKVGRPRRGNINGKRKCFEF